jgi:thioredoxin reductase (NADPH)
MYDVIILGSGPAGLTAALYCARGGKKTLVLGGGELFGTLNKIPNLENYPGWSGSGRDLGETMKKQAENFGAEIIMTSAVVVKERDFGFIITGGDGVEYESKTVIIATGASPRKLDIKGSREFLGRGVSYCATCDGFFYSGKTVLVIGGGNSAINDALYLSDIAGQVKIVYRKSSFMRAESCRCDNVLARENIECVFNTEIAEIGGDASGVTYAITTDGKKIDCDGVFIAIGHEANTDYLPENMTRDDAGRIVGPKLPAGMFVAGDVRAKRKMQVATAVGTGCEAAMDAVAYLNSK